MPKLLNGCQVQTDGDRLLLQFMEDKFLPLVIALKQQGYTQEDVVEGLKMCLDMFLDRN